MTSATQHIEVTGERVRAYDRWRENLSALPLGTYNPPVFIEHSKLPGARDNTGWPLLDIHCLLLMSALKEGERVRADILEQVISERRDALPIHANIASRLGVPLFVGITDFEVSRFLVQQIGLNETYAPVSLDRAQFGERVIKQRFHRDPRSQDSFRSKKDESRYSSWHRHYLTSGSYLHDIDYVELRNDLPVGVIEVTKANRDRQRSRSDSYCLRKGFSDFLTRGFAQSALLLQSAEKISVNCYCAVYITDESSDTLSKLFLVKMTRELVALASELHPQRIERSEEYLQELIREHRGKLTPEARRRYYSWANGRACAELFEENKDALAQLVKRTERKEFTVREYEEWLVSLTPSASL